MTMQTTTTSERWPDRYAQGTAVVLGAERGAKLTTFDDDGLRAARYCLTLCITSKDEILPQTRDRWQLLRSMIDRVLTEREGWRQLQALGRANGVGVAMGSPAGRSSTVGQPEAPEGPSAQGPQGPQGPKGPSGGSKVARQPKPKGQPPAGGLLQPVPASTLATADLF